MNAVELEFPEPERYELREGPRYRFEANRREFLQVLGAGLLISVSGGPLLAQRARSSAGAGPSERLHIATDGSITLLSGKVEVGQGSRTQLVQAAAEELNVPIARIQLILADSDLVPDDGGTAGSRTTPSTVPAVRRACAAARQILLQTAAATLNADLNSLSVREGQVQGLGLGQHFGYADMAAEPHASTFAHAQPEGVELTPVAKWNVLGTPVSRVNALDIVTGQHRYPSDIQRPGMLHAVVLRPPAYGAELTHIDLDPARAMENVVAVHDGDFVGFAAPASREARQAREAVARTVQWTTKPHPPSDELQEYLRSHAANGRSRRQSRGDVEEKLKAGAHTLRQTYFVPYVQHAPMEPRAAVAEWKDGHLTVWTGTQQPSRVRDELARAFRLARDHVRLIVPDTGGGFGGKHTGEAAVEAARLAQAARKPVSLRWSREDEFTWAYYRPAGVIDLAAALDETGSLAAWEQINFNSGASALESPYAIAHTATEFKNCDQPLRSGSYRALASTANNFARESFMDELAAAAGVDPLTFRLRHLNNDRLRAVLTAATDHFGWKQKWQPHSPSQNAGYGLACGTEKGSYVATCAEVAIDSKGCFRVTSVCEAFECGAIQNPANLKAQIEGCIIQGLGAVLHEEIRFREGRILNPRFSQYRVPRFANAPDILAVLVNRPDLASVGAGETPIIGIAPAVANALCNATGKRLRSLPLASDSLRSS